MKRILLTFPLAFLLATLIHAQNPEIGLFFGASAYQGDLSPEQLRLNNIGFHPALGLFGRYNLNSRFSARLGVTYGTLSGDDANASDESRRARNLSFRSRFFELALTGEFHILPYEPLYSNRLFAPYVFGGVAVFRFNPEANYNGDLIELQPLGTEGQGMDGFPARYKRTQIAVPLGGGIKIALSPRLTLGLEAGLRKTFTDYIDDVSTEYVTFNDLASGNGELSALLANRMGEYLNAEPVILPTGSQRGNPDADDWYGTIGATISYHFDGGNGRLLGNRKNQTMGCPKF